MPDETMRQVGEHIEGCTALACMAEEAWNTPWEWEKCHEADIDDRVVVFCADENCSARLELAPSRMVGGRWHHA